MRCPRWTRLKTFFGNQLFATAFFGIAIILRTSEALKDIMPAGEFDRFNGMSFCLAEGACMNGASFFPAASVFFVAAASSFFGAGLLYSLAVPGVIAGYPNRGDFVSAARGESDFDEAAKRLDWEKCNKENLAARWAVWILIVLFLLLFSGFLAFASRIAFFALLGR